MAHTPLYTTKTHYITINRMKDSYFLDGISILVFTRKIYLVIRKYNNCNMESYEHLIVRS